MPYALCIAFSESREFAQLQAQYHDGTNERSKLAQTSRRTFKLAQRLTAAQVTVLKAFWDGQQDENRDSTLIRAPIKPIAPPRAVPPWAGGPPASLADAGGSAIPVPARIPHLQRGARAGSPPVIVPVMLRHRCPSAALLPNVARHTQQPTALIPPVRTRPAPQDGPARSTNAMPAPPRRSQLAPDCSQYIVPPSR